MSNDNFRRELNNAFDDIAGSPSPAFRDRVRSRLTQVPEARGPFWIAAVAAAAIAVLVVGALLVANAPRRPPQVTGRAPSPAASPTPSASPSAAPSPTQASQLPPFACAIQDFVAKPGSPTVAYVSALRTGTHGTYDRITIEFANGVPQEVKVSSPGGTTFTASPSGQTLTLRGDHGILITIHGADLHTSYSGPIDIVTGYGTVVEVRRVQDFEGVVQLGLGVNGAGCYRAFWLTNPDRLVIDVQTGG